MTPPTPAACQPASASQPQILSQPGQRGHRRDPNYELSGSATLTIFKNTRISERRLDGSVIRETLPSNMITATKRWLRRNRTSFAIGFGVVGVGYVASQYVISKITEARDRTTSDRIAKEKCVSPLHNYSAPLTASSLRRRFLQNQEDCTITVLELLPTVTENVLEALPSEKITQELQQKKAERLGRSAAASEIAPSEQSSGAPSAVEEDAKSLSSESYIHASQVATSSSSGGGEARQARSKVQLWNELKISCKYNVHHFSRTTLIFLSHYTSFYSSLYSIPPQHSYSHTIESSWQTKLSI